MSFLSSRANSFQSPACVQRLPLREKDACNRTTWPIPVQCPSRSPPCTMCTVCRPHSWTKQTRPPAPSNLAIMHPLDHLSNPERARASSRFPSTANTRQSASRSRTMWRRLRETPSTSLSFSCSCGLPFSIPNSLTCFFLSRRPRRRRCRPLPEEADLDVPAYSEPSSKIFFHCHLPRALPVSNPSPPSSSIDRR